MLRGKVRRCFTLQQQCLRNQGHSFRTKQSAVSSAGHGHLPQNAKFRSSGALGLIAVP